MLIEIVLAMPCEVKPRLPGRTRSGRRHGLWRPRDLVGEFAIVEAEGRGPSGVKDKMAGGWPSVE